MSYYNPYRQPPPPPKNDGWIWVVFWICILAGVACGLLGFVKGWVG